MKSRHLTHTVLLISMAALTPAVLAQSNVNDRTKRTDGEESTTSRTPATGAVATDEKMTVQPGSLTTVIADGPSFSTLTKALKASGLDATLGNKDEFTIFAPTDEAFGKLPDGTLAKLMLPENKEKLRALLLYHVVAGRVLAADLVNGDVKSVNGAALTVAVSSDKIEVDGAKVSTSDVAATNGVMHSIGKVMVPKSLDGFAGLKN